MKMLIVDFANLFPFQTRNDREIVVENHRSKLMLYALSGRSKKIAINRFAVADDLFFEGLGLWVGEGGKSKGLYFGNSCPELMLHFLSFVEQKLGLQRSEFRITLNVPAFANKSITKEKWSSALHVPKQNFTNICVDPRINKEYVQVYLNSVALVEFMDKLLMTMKQTILSNEKYASAFLKGLFAAEGQVALKRWGTIFYIGISSIDMDLIEFIKKCLGLLGISSGKYVQKGRKLQIYGYKNLKRFKELCIHTLHPKKREKFEQGFASYKRVNVLDGEEARTLILQQLASGPKTYDDLAAALGKARTTIQAHHIPILEREGKVKRAGKRGQAWLFALAENKSSVEANV